MNSKRINGILKRTYDILFAAVFLIITGWIMLITAIVIKCTSKGPILYKAKRVGLNGRSFTVYKFRSMRVDSGAVKVTTLTNDERIYPFGKFIRTAKIDELPQLFNLLLGNMSVVGPRPEDIDVAEEYYVGEYEKIYSAKPGLTSPASLFDYTHGELYDDEEAYINEFLPKKLDVELHYVNNNNIFYDIYITAKTAVIIFLRVAGKKDFKYPKEYLKCRSIKEAVNEREGALKA